MFVSSGRESWILACCGIEQHLRIKYIMVLERRTEYSELSSKSIVEGFLGHIDFRDKNVIVHILDDCVVVHQAE